MSDTLTTKDHDLLIVLNAKLDQLSIDVKELKDGTSMKIADHELRIKANEKWISEQKLNMRWILTIASVAGSIVTFIITKISDIFQLIEQTH